MVANITIMNIEFTAFGARNSIHHAFAIKVVICSSFYQIVNCGRQLIINEWCSYEDPSFRLLAHCFPTIEDPETNSSYHIDSVALFFEHIPKKLKLIIEGILVRVLLMIICLIPVSYAFVNYLSLSNLLYSSIT
ncbi:hypothetical protein ACOME3_003661 [Neoechinorhynchus agilis]